MLYHGGVPGLKPGDLIEPGHSRDDRHDDCPLCRMRRDMGADAPTPVGTRRSDMVYCTTDRLYARLYASLYGRGDVYQVEPVGPLVPSTDEGDPEGSWRCRLLRVKRIVDVAVTLSMKERRRLARRSPDPLNPLPRNATPEMRVRWWRRQVESARRIVDASDVDETADRR